MLEYLGLETKVKLMVFTTGAQLPPPKDFTQQPSIQFTAHGTLPTASTCSCTLFLPLRQSVNLDSTGDPDYDYGTFRERMDVAVLHTVGLGLL